MRLLIAGVSTRAAAESAASARFTVTGLDAFADIDQHPDVRALSVSRDFDLTATASHLARAASGLAVDAVAYLSPFENHPNAVTRLARGRQLLGNPPAVLRRVRDPFVVHDELAGRGLVVPRLWQVAPERAVSALIKPRASGGGRRIRPWTSGMVIPAGSYLQERIEGTPGAVTFVASAGQAAVIGVSQQLIGDPAFGAHGYRYCGSIMAAPDDGGFGDDPVLLAAAHTLARAATDAFGLVGVNGVDFIARGQMTVPIEINPRWTASIELVASACSVPLMAAHADACRSAALPLFDVAPAPGVRGKAIVFARQDASVGDTSAWLPDAAVRDVPRPGQLIRRGEPVCTVLASAPDFRACYARLVQCAAAIYDRLKQDGPRIQGTSSPVD